MFISNASSQNSCSALSCTTAFVPSISTHFITYYSLRFVAALTLSDFGSSPDFIAPKVLNEIMALSSIADDIDPVVERNNCMSSPVKLLSLQLYERSESEDSDSAARLPSMGKRKPLEKDAKDLMPDSDSSQQQQQSPSLTTASSSSCPVSHTSTEANPTPSQQIQHVKKTVEAPPSASPRGPPGNQGIKAARQRFLQEKAAKLRKVQALSEPLNIERQGSETYLKSSKALHNQSVNMYASSSMSSTSQISVKSKAAPRPVVLNSSESLHAQSPTSSTTTTNAFYNRTSLHGRRCSALQHPRPQFSNDPSYLSLAMMGDNPSIRNDNALRENLYIKVCDLPDNITTRELWGAFKHEGHISHIRLFENAKGCRDGGARIKFKYVSKFGLCSKPS